MYMRSLQPYVHVDWNVNVDASESVKDSWMMRQRVSSEKLHVADVNSSICITSSILLSTLQHPLPTGTSNSKLLGQLQYNQLEMVNGGKKWLRGKNNAINIELLGGVRSVGLSMMLASAIDLVHLNPSRNVHPSFHFITWCQVVHVSIDEDNLTISSWPDYCKGIQVQDGVLWQWWYLTSLQRWPKATTDEQHAGGDMELPGAALPPPTNCCIKALLVHVIVVIVVRNSADKVEYKKSGKRNAPVLGLYQDPCSWSWKQWSVGSHSQWRAINLLRAESIHSASNTWYHLRVLFASW